MKTPSCPLDVLDYFHDVFFVQAICCEDQALDFVVVDAVENHIFDDLVGVVLLAAAGHVCAHAVCRPAPVARHEELAVRG